MKKIESFNITVVCSEGKNTLTKCRNFPTKEDFEKHIDSLEGMMGEAKKIIIDKIRWS